MGIAKEKAFPRGGLPSKPTSTSLSPATATPGKVVKKKDRDLFSTKPAIQPSASKKKNKSKKAKKSGQNKDDDILDIKSLDPLTYDKLNEGLKVMARISEVRDLELKLSLPGRLVASVPITQISNSYTNGLKKITENPDLADEIGIQTLETTFKVGQLVICSIVSVEKSDNDFFKVQASLNPELVNENLILSKNSLLTASVKSVEDHGYVMDIGKSNMKAFLPLKKSGKTPPSVGQVIPCSVTKVDGTAVVLNAAKLKPLSNVDNASVHTMHPGMIFDTTFENYIKNGVKLKIGKDFRGYVHDAHVGSEDFEPGTEVRAVVLYVLPTVNTICMSLLTDQLSFDKTSKSLHDRQVKIGSLVKNAVVIEANASLGLEVKLRGDDEEEEETEVGIVPIKHLNETQRKEIKTKFPPKTKVTVRVLQFDQFEQRFVCSMLKTMLEQNMIKADQLKPGDLVSAKAKKFVSKGLIVEVGRNVDGFLPHLHLSDIPLKNPEKKFSVGDKIKCRVLRSDPSKKKLHLTAKKILVDREDYVVVDDYNEKFANAITEGVVVKVSNEGVLLQLFGEATGWVPKSKISVEPVEYPEKLFFLGQVLKCQVVDVNTSKNKITLSLIIGGDSKMKPLGSKQKKAVESIKLGHVYEDVKICEVSQEGIAVEVSEQKLKAFIPVNHLTDHVSLADQLLNTYKPGDVISKVMCFEKDVVPILTLKPSVMNFQGKGMTFDELHEGQVIPGVVALVKEYGAFLKLPTIKFRKSALIPTRYLSDIFVDNPGDLVQVHQTLYGKIVEKSGNDDQNNRLTMSAKPRMVLEGENPAEKSMETLESFVQDIERIRQHHGNPDLLVHKVGDVVNCVVQDVNEFGIMTVLEGANQNQIRGLVPMASLEGLPQPSLGQTLAGVILFIDYQHSCVELSLNPEIVRKAATTKKTVKAGDILKASCVLRRSEHFMATMFCSKTGRFFHIPLRHHINDQIGFGDSLNMYKDQYSIVMKNEALSLAVLDNKRANQMLKRKRVNSLSDETTQIPEKVPKTVESPEAKKSKKKKKRQDSDKDEVPDVHEIKMETAAFPVEEDPGWSEDFNPFAMEMNQNAVASVKDEADTDVKPKKVKTHLSKKEKKELDKLEQAEIERAEQRVIDGEDAPPESVDEFDRLVLATPDSSLCWIQYIAFHLEKKNIEAARSVVKRALEKINFREETERFNVYMAWFNLENTFGTEEETEKVYKEAIQCNDEYKVYDKVASIYMQSGKTEKAEKIYKIMARKFAKELDVWTTLGQFYFKTDNLKEARFTLQRSLQNLKKTTEIVAVTSKFAQFEFQLGEAERGKTIFENIVRDFPQRTDQWMVYADQLVKRNEIEAAREVFDRMISLNLPPKKMKSLFKKYWEFEQRQGDQVREDAVRKKALEYLEKHDIKVENEEDPIDQMDVC